MMNVPLIQYPVEYKSNSSINVQQVYNECSSQYRLAGWLARRLVGWEAGWLEGRPSGWLAGRLAGRQASWLAGRQAGWKAFHYRYVQH